MNDYLYGFLIFVCGLSIFLGLALALHETGRKQENRRLFDKCLVINSDMTYNRAVEICKERMK